MSKNTVKTHGVGSFVEFRKLAVSTHILIRYMACCARYSMLRVIYIRGTYE